MISRLPLNLEFFAVERTVGSDKKNNHEEAVPIVSSDINHHVKNQMVSVAVHGCNIIFEAFVQLFDKLIDVDLSAFVSLMSQFLIILATNMTSVDRSHSNQ